MLRSFLLCATLACLLTACKNNADKPTNSTTQESAAAKTDADKPLNGKFCFTITQDKVVTDVSLNINNGVVTGEMSEGAPDTDGATGTLKGTLKGNMINAVYAYTVEGSDQKVDVIYKFDGNSLVEMTGPLDPDPSDPMYMKIKNPATATATKTFTKTNCK